MTTNCTATNGQFACTLRAHHSGNHVFVLKPKQIANN